MNNSRQDDSDFKFWSHYLNKSKSKGYESEQI